MVFSYLCKICNTGIKSSGVNGERCYLFLLSDGNIIEIMNGEYNNKGSVFKEGLKDSYNWKSDNWNNLVELHFSDNEKNGFAAYHERCYQNHRPTTRSDNDPFRGKGDYKLPEDDSGSHSISAKIENFLNVSNKDTINEFFNNQKNMIKQILK